MMATNDTNPGCRTCASDVGVPVGNAGLCAHHADEALAELEELTIRLSKIDALAEALTIRLSKIDALAVERLKVFDRYVAEMNGLGEAFSRIQQEAEERHRALKDLGDTKSVQAMAYALIEGNKELADIVGRQGPGMGVCFTVLKALREQGFDLVKIEKELQTK